MGFMGNIYDDIFKWRQGSGIVGKRTAEKSKLQENWKDILKNDTSGFDWNEIISKALGAIHHVPKRALSELDQKLKMSLQYESLREHRVKMWQAKMAPERENRSEYTKEMYMEQFGKEERKYQRQHERMLAEWKAEYNKRINVQELAKLTKQRQKQTEINAKRWELLKIGSGITGRSGKETEGTGGEYKRRRRGIAGLTVGLQGAGLGIPGV